VRLDQLLVSRGLCESRERARRSVMAGLVFVGDRRVDKPGTPVDPEVEVRLEGSDEPYASRAGRKLEEALDPEPPPPPLETLPPPQAASPATNKPVAANTLINRNMVARSWLCLTPIKVGKFHIITG